MKFKIPSFIKDDSIAVAEFKTITKQLSELDSSLITNVDMIQLGMYCHLFSVYKKCLDDEAENGLFTAYTNKGNETNMVESPASKLRRATETQMMMLSKSFGLDPLARRRLTPQPEQKEDDEFADFD